MDWADGEREREATIAILSRPHLTYVTRIALSVRFVLEYAAAAEHKATNASTVNQPKAENRQSRKDDPNSDWRCNACLCTCRNSPIGFGLGPYAFCRISWMSPPPNRKFNSVRQSYHTATMVRVCTQNIMYPWCLNYLMRSRTSIHSCIGKNFV